MDTKLKQTAIEIAEKGRRLSLATLREDGYPQANTVNYANNGLILYFGTARSSGKIKNIQYCSKVSLTINLPYDDWSQIRGLSMAAIARVLADDSPDSVRAMNHLLARFPSPSDVSPPSGPGQIVFVELMPRFVSVIDYTQGFGHSELVEICATDLDTSASQARAHCLTKNAGGASKASVPKGVSENEI